VGGGDKDVARASVVLLGDEDCGGVLGGGVGIQRAEHEHGERAAERLDAVGGYGDGGDAGERVREDAADADRRVREAGELVKK
jgi:hypothetical protein